MLRLTKQQLTDEAKRVREALSADSADQTKAILRALATLLEHAAQNAPSILDIGRSRDANAWPHRPQGSTR